jgi:large subunit ribosomal protein L29
MKAEDLKNMKKQDLVDELMALRKQQFDLKMKVSMGEETRNHLLKNCRKDIARIKTVMNAASLDDGVSS